MWSTLVFMRLCSKGRATAATNSSTELIRSFKYCFLLTPPAPTSTCLLHLAQQTFLLHTHNYPQCSPTILVPSTPAGNAQAGRQPTNLSLLMPLQCPHIPPSWLSVTLRCVFMFMYLSPSLSLMRALVVFPAPNIVRSIQTSACVNCVPVPSPSPSAFQVFIHLIFTIAPWSACFGYAQLMNEENSCCVLRSRSHSW